MAEQLSQRNCDAMIQALYDFRGRAYSLAQYMHSLGLQAASALDESDNAVAAIRRDLRTCTVKYSELTDRAMKLAKGLEEEAQLLAKDNATWYNED